MHRCLVLLRSRTGAEDGCMVRCSVEWVAGDTGCDCQLVEADGSAGAPARSTATRDANLHGDVLSAVPASGPVHVAADCPRASRIGSTGSIPVVCLFERTAAGHATPTPGNEGRLAARSLAG